MRLKLYYDAGRVSQNPANGDSDLVTIRALLTELENRGIRTELIEVNTIPERELASAYAESWIPAMRKKYEIRQVFGSRRRSGGLFGKSIPALLVYEGENGHPTDVYPHRQGGQLVTIREFLESLASAPAARATEVMQAASRMDQRRTRLGPVGIRASELIHEGRRR